MGVDMTRIAIYDTTLRDGSQGEGVNFSLQDKLLITQRLDELGVDYIEGGYPLSNPKDAAYFQAVRDLDLTNARVSAFGMTRRRDTAPEDDTGLCRIGARTQVVTVVGKCWDLHAREVLGVSLDDEWSQLDENAGEKDERQGILYVGGLDWRKNVNLIPDAIALLPPKLRGARDFVVAGDSPIELRRSLAEYWDKKGLSPNRLVFRGHVTDAELARLYRSSEILVQPSFMEGLGLTVLEAMSTGVPIAAARAGAMPEIVGRDDLLFDPEDAGALASLLQQVLEGHTLREEIVKQCQARARGFTWEAVADRAVAVLGPKVKVTRRRSESFDAARHRTLGIWTSLDAENTDKSIDTDEAAHLFALAEPPPFDRRLIVDVHQTMLHDARTGIQRVVKMTCDSLVGSSTTRDPQIILSRSCGTDRLEVHGRFGDGTIRQTEQHVQPGPCDTILMLDSSWSFHAEHRHFMNSARLQGASVVTCLYDLVPIRLPATCHPVMPGIFAEWLRAALEISNGFLCISRAVADELIELLQAINYPRPLKIGYWQLGADFDQAPERLRHVAPRRNARPSFLMVGTIEPRKGHALVLNAFERLWGEGRDIELKVVGRPGWGASHVIERLRRHPELGGRLIWYDDADDALLVHIYRQCDALIAASFGEGFGLPLVEAGHFGKPIIASDLPVFHEVTQAAVSARFFKTGSVEALADAVRASVTYDVGKPYNAAEGQEARQWPTWDESAQQLRNVILAGNWYRTYQPGSKADPWAPLSFIGPWRMTAPLATIETHGDLVLEEGPLISHDGPEAVWILSVKNTSPHCWSSAGGPADSLGIYLEAHPANESGTPSGATIGRSAIPFVLPSGGTILMRLAIPLAALPCRPTDVFAAIIQPASGPVSKFLRLPLPASEQRRTA